MMEQEIETAWVWETFRPMTEAVSMMQALKRDPFDLVPLEDYWQEKVLPALVHRTYQVLAPLVREELERRIVLVDKRKKELFERYDDTRTPFHQRRELMERKLPTLEKIEKELLGHRNKIPFLNWEPIDRDGIKRMGTEKFIRFNFNRFYGNH